MKARIGIFLLACTGILGAVSAQKIEQLRITTNTVLVDVVATDKNNRHVLDLRKEELQVLENDIQQEVDSCEPVHKPGTAKIETLPGMPPESGSRVIHASKEALGNLMVILLDYATVEYIHQDRVRKAAIRYVRESMHPSDVLAVFRVGSSFNLVQDFTSDKEKLVAALEKLDATGSKFAFDQAKAAWDAQNAQGRIRTLISNIDSLRANPSSYGASVSLAIEILDRQRDMVENLEARAFAELSQSRQMQARPVIAAIEAIALALRRYQGRKTLILFSEGFSVGLALEKSLYHAVDLANKSNTAIYAIDGAGLRHKEPVADGELYDISALKPGDRARANMGISQFDRAREVGSDQTDSTLRFMTAATGGVLIRHTNDLFGALQRIDNDIRGYYILSYRPSNTIFDGAFRTIKVRTNRPGVTLRFRQGYFAIPPAASLLLPDEYADLLNVRNGRITSDEKVVDVQAYTFLGEHGRSRVMLSIEFPAELAESQSAENGMVLYPKVLGTVLDQNGEIVSSFRSPSKVSLAREASHEPAQQMVSLVNELSLAPGQYSVEVYVGTKEKHRVGYQTRSLNLEDHENQFTLSSIVLSNRSSLNGSTSRMEHFPSATHRFRNSDKVIFYLYAYNPPSGAGDEAALDISAIVRNDTRSITAQLEPFTVTRFESTGVPHAVVSRFVDMANLPLGRYQLETRVTDRHSGKTATAQTAFTVVR